MGERQKMAYKTIFKDIQSVKNALGQEIGISDWLEITQERINTFADATGDHQWIHIDPERAKKESPYGTTIAHGYLTLSLIANFSDKCYSNEFSKMIINYGANKIRFPSPVKVNSKIRARYTLESLDEIEGGIQVQWVVTIDIEGQDKPACVAQSLTRWYF